MNSVGSSEGISNLWQEGFVAELSWKLA